MEQRKIAERHWGRGRERIINNKINGASGSVHTCICTCGQHIACQTMYELLNFKVALVILECSEGKMPAGNCIYV